MFILEQLSLRYPAFLPLKQDLFNQYIELKRIGKLLELLNSHEIVLSHTQLQALASMLEEADTGVFPHDPVALQEMVNRLMNLLPEKTELLLKRSVTVLLQTKEPVEIKLWMNPLKSKAGSRQTFDKIEAIVELSDSLNNMQSLGELYFEFQQFERAIECFSWEMELDPTNPKPLQWLAKVYHEMGQEQESEVYQQLCINVQKWG
jgi:tetratricopeptide (TPR) repeat protein